ncbi:uncharacterized protein LOC141632173 [Silene latifolia]|uniref:uncharacterized protein LOC141632173 n=1 Tax=Silene latifolia TaxID=37657 RepID=UPI003D776F33
MAKVHHLMLDDTNFKYFYSKIAERKKSSSIGSICNAVGEQCKGATEVAAAFIGYYKELLGTETPVDPVPPTLLRTGKFPSSALLSLLAAVSHSEIRSVLASIDKNSSPGIDGYNLTITKILANRLKGFMGDVVGPEQAAFVQGRDIFDNSFLAHELAAKYSISLITP